ncbi:MAG: PleD family two-component system response regulator [Rhizobiaceae bacterium]
MTARILVVDDIPANVKLLEARLSAEYFQVITAMNGLDALELCERMKIDVVLLDVMMPGMDGFEVCRRLKANPATAEIPVVMVTALDQPADRVRGLRSGADDFLTKPVNDLQLVTRVKSLVRLKTLTDELKLRAATARGMNRDDQTPALGDLPEVMLVDDRPGSADRIVHMLSGMARVDVVADANAALLHAVDRPIECVIVSGTLAGTDPLRICSQFRSFDRTRNVPMILVTELGDNERIIRALDIGVNDYITRPIEKEELQARLQTQLRRKRYNDRLRQSVSETIELAVTDSLTGLHNRRYLDNHLETLVERAQARRRPLSVLIADIDRFKAVNDSWGHDAGDEVLREFARRLRGAVRGIDLACRHGGEEFIVVMPDTDPEIAHRVGERVRTIVSGQPFALEGQTASLDVTVSVGIATLDAGDTAAALVKRADQALYEAKNAGRNRVVLRAA